MNELKQHIENIANEEGMTELQVITLLQSEAAKMDDNENFLGELIELKREYI